MKNQKKIVSMIVLCISILFCLFTCQISYAEDEITEGDNTIQTEPTPDTVVDNETELPENGTDESNQTQQNDTGSQSGQTQSTDTSTQTTGTQSVNTNNRTTTTKSSNANLNNLGITPYDFTGFKYWITSYEVEVPNDTETVEVYANTEDKKATVSGTGSKNLEEGENKIEVVVTAEDGTQKTYTISIIRETEEDEDTDDDEIIMENSNGLLELKINNLKLSPEFKTDIYQYTVKYIGEDTKLDIEANPTNDNYIVEITGNEELTEGENIISILVSEENGDNVATYQITVNKSLVDEEAIAKEQVEKKAQQKKLY